MNKEENILNEELKRLHELLTLVAADENMRNRVLDMISNLHLNLTPTIILPKVPNENFY